ncbi:MAG: M15 family metallopeptidase [Patescibacteria group bacterium]
MKNNQQSTTAIASLLRPGENDTALILGIVYSDKKRREINDLILDEYPNVEQVGFINNDANKAELIMAGEEFCANATRCAAYEILEGKPGDILIKVSGVNKKLKAGIRSDGEAYAQIPIFADPKKIMSDQKYSGNFIVEMEGIVHYVDFSSSIQGLTSEQIKDKGLKEIKKLGYDQAQAVGYIFAQKEGDSYTIAPIVYVREIQTTFFETACGSGSMAVTMVEALKTGKSITELAVIQPSGLVIKASVFFDKKNFGYAEISGPIKRLPKNTRDLEKTMVRYQDLQPIKTKDNKDGWIKIDQDQISTEYMPGMDDMKSITGSQIIVREKIYNMLLQAQKQLKKVNKNYTLVITYGYRNLEIQKRKFLQELKNIDSFFENPIDMYEEVHRFIAVPTVAGHPTGGAIDIVIKDEKTNKILDFGSKQYDYLIKDCYVFTDSISSEASNNRMLLRQLLTDVGFSPFDGEWWHFSYGDREWAYYYKEPYAIYNQKDYDEVRKLL